MSTSEGPVATTLDPGDILSSAVEIYKSQAATLLGAAVIVFAVEALLALLLGVIGSLLAVVVGTFFNGMVVNLVRDVQDGRRDLSIGQLLSSVTPVWLPLLAVSILAGIGIGIGFVLLIVPGLFLMTIWSVVAPVVVIEKPGVFDAFGRSRELVRGNGWQVFGVIVIVVVILIGVSILAALIASGLNDVGRAIVQWILNVATAPLAALLVAVLYFALRRAHGEGAVGDPVVGGEPGGQPAV